MSEAAPDPGAVGVEGLIAQMEALRSNPATRPDPVRLQYVEAMARRLQAASPAVRNVLLLKLAEALQSLGNHAETGPVPPPLVHSMAGAFANPSTVRSVPAEGRVPRSRKSGAQRQPEAVPPNLPLTLLGQLNQHIQIVSSAPEDGGSKRATQGLAQNRLRDLRSTVRFRETWARISAETAVDQATHRAPENAGPLNAHNLVLRALGHMRDLSPDYLRRFMGHADSLMWLDQAYGQLKQPAGKAKTKVGRAKK